LDDPVRPPHLDGATRTVGVVGWPVEHSLSPAIHNAAFRALELDWVYVPLPVEPSRIGAALEGIRALGLAGANITMPHKGAAAAGMDSLSEDAARLQAVNTVVVDGSSLLGHNTDAPGFDRFLRRDAGFDPAARSALVFGAGGAARACALALARAGASSIAVAAREPARVDDVRMAVEGLPTKVEAVAFADAAEVEADLVVNATPVGRDGEMLPLPRIHQGMVVVDLLYHPSVTPLMTAARSGGAATFGGIGLLLHQAALSFELWTGRQPPLDVMSAAASAALIHQA
jgi:shikimate dehydrogenase